MSETVLTPPAHTVPTAFTRAQLDWLPWLEPLAVEAMTERHLASLVDAARVKSPYFRLLARDPDALEARTRTDKDIFYNPDAGLPRAERELAAAATSRVNGCLYCASVHARHAATYSKREDDVQRLLDAGVTADLGERWNAIVAAAVALTETPGSFGAEHVRRLRAAGLDDAAVADVIQGAAFFNWANRLMLSLGEPQATWSAAAVAAIAWNVAVVSIGGMSLYYFMLNRGAAGRVAANFYLVPGVVALLGWWLLGETLPPLALGGLALASLGVWLTQSA